MEPLLSDNLDPCIASLKGALKLLEVEDFWKRDFPQEAFIKSMTALQILAEASAYLSKFMDSLHHFSCEEWEVSFKLIKEVENEREG